MSRKRSNESAAGPTAGAESSPEDEPRPGQTEPRSSGSKKAGRNKDEASASARPGENGAGGAAMSEDGAGASVERAEQMIDQFAERVGHYTSVVGHQLLRLGMRAREEAEDMWAEAQSIRNKRRGP